MHPEKVVVPKSGLAGLVLAVGFFAASIVFLVLAVMRDDRLFLLPAAATVLIGILLAVGLFVVQPNQSKVLVLFGTYIGSVKSEGFWFANPFAKKIPVSLRARTLNGEKLKVNELTGNPIEIAVVVVWRIEDTAKASFDVDDYTQYVHTQSESAVRKLASSYPYDGAEDRITLRGNRDEVNHHLQQELPERVGLAGVRVIEARLSHLAYAPEIAGAMLQRQQAQTVVDARTTIVEGAVGMVEHALQELNAKNVVELDDERSLCRAKSRSCSGWIRTSTKTSGAGPSRSFGV